MQLPFTREQFFDLFAAYNAAVWPAVVVLWIASAAISVLLLSSRRLPDRWIFTIQGSCARGTRQVHETSHIRGTP